MEIEYNKPLKAGRPIKYFSEKERKEAKSRYGKKWYENNKEKILEKYKDEKYNEIRCNQKHKGFFRIYNSYNNDVYLSYSADVSNRKAQMLSKIRNTNEVGRVIGLFDKSLDWKFNFICFWEDNDINKLNKIKEELTGENPEINFL
tara:strand:- start:326 stop:763 length:438 start_codon:yes stop_codon:yes gene_type:complete